MTQNVTEQSSISKVLAPIAALVRLFEKLGCRLDDFQYVIDDPLVRRQIAFLIMSRRVGLPDATSHLDEDITTRFIEAVFDDNKPDDWRKYLEPGAVRQMLSGHGSFDGAIVVYAFGLNGRSPVETKRLAKMFSLSEQEARDTVKVRCQQVRSRIIRRSH